MSDINKPDKNKLEKSSEPVEYRLIPIQEDDTDAKELFFRIIRLVWDSKLIIVGFIAAFLLIGIIIASLSQEEFNSEARLMPEYMQEGSRSQNLLSQFGGQFGLGGGNTYSGSSDAIRVSLYPQITQSLPLMLQVMDEEVYIATLDTNVTIYDYFTELHPRPLGRVIGDYTIRLPITLYRKMRSSGTPSEVITEADVEEIDSESEIVDLSVTRRQLSVVNQLRGRISTEIESGSGIVKISVVMPDPEMAKRINDIVVKYLSEYIVEYRTEKVTMDLEFIQERYDEIGQRFRTAQSELARFRDENRNIATASAQTELQRLQSEYDLAFDLYRSTTQRLEQTKIKLQEETPVFKTLEPAIVPFNEIAPNSRLIILFSVVFGGFLSIAFIFGREGYYFFKEVLTNRS